MEITIIDKRRGLKSDDAFRPLSGVLSVNNNQADRNSSVY